MGLYVYELIIHGDSLYPLVMESRVCRELVNQMQMKIQSSYPCIRVELYNYMYSSYIGIMIKKKT